MAVHPLLRAGAPAHQPCMNCIKNLTVDDVQFQGGGTPEGYHKSREVGGLMSWFKQEGQCLGYSMENCAMVIHLQRMNSIDNTHRKRGFHKKLTNDL